MTAIAEPRPACKAPLYIWLKSEFIDSNTRFRFDSSDAEVKQANWAFGIPLAAPPNSDVGLIDSVDGRFDGM